MVITKVINRKGGGSGYNHDIIQYYKNELTVSNIIGIKNDENNTYSGINGWFASYFDLKLFHNYLSDKFKNRDGYYSWNGLSYFLDPTVRITLYYPLCQASNRLLRRPIATTTEPTKHL